VIPSGNSAKRDGQEFSDLPQESSKIQDGEHPSEVQHEDAIEHSAILPERLKTPTSPLLTASSNKRKRFASEHPDDATAGVEMTANDNATQASGGAVLQDASEDDGDDAPEVLSSKTAAREVLSLPNLSSRTPTRKKRRTAQNLPSEEDYAVPIPHPMDVEDVQVNMR